MLSPTQINLTIYEPTANLVMAKNIVTESPRYGKTSDYDKSIQEADLPKIAKLLKIFGMNLQ
jgi:hypothetical protein